MVLLQTMIMSLLMAFIAMSVMGWVLNRYQSASRTYRGSAAGIRTSGYAMKLVSTPNLGGCGGASLDGIAFDSCSNSGGVITIKYDENL